ncbi:DUF1963 domain-containing protein [Flammeovirga kamogawensis]|uniref:DUF1963 domain-containing protein n=1 Tax=Flammeovirga kamogawensis TaxID=373891 RepID=A0ABX8H5T1_9BACT|nr:DUF1963 domain-containing protein [Flammeovirga kamogawensis]MBB6463858.1 uncharacterized protein YwqG [Flammeovirga kamogawensis]QWG10782.1 DUF1963 domain-containing protein [Flammeovirga kamogawensis]TRX63232.1 DUF1963 domain-containing protein [Flammeovirga kamogawensis]
MLTLKENEIQRSLFSGELFGSIGLGKKEYFPKSFKETKKSLTPLHKKMQWADTKEKKRIESELTPSLRIDFMKYGNYNLPYGSSKFGGNADLSEDVLQQVLKEEDIPLLCQINLVDIKVYDLYKGLPQKGILYFFFNESIEGDNEKIIVHYDENGEVQKDKETSGYKTLFYPIYTFPNNMEIAFDRVSQKKENEGLFDKLIDFEEDLGNAMDTHWYDTIFMGQPKPLQPTSYDTTRGDEEGYICLLDFAYRDPKYHVLISAKDFKALNFDATFLVGATT